MHSKRSGSAPKTPGFPKNSDIVSPSNKKQIGYNFVQGGKVKPAPTADDIKAKPPISGRVVPNAYKVVKDEGKASPTPKAP